MRFKNNIDFIKRLPNNERNLNMKISTNKVNLFNSNNIIKIGDKVLLESNILDSLEGPLKQGDVGEVVEIDNSYKPLKIKFNNKTWWYSKKHIVQFNKKSTNNHTGTTSTARLIANSLNRPKMVGKPVAQSRVGRTGSPLANSINQTTVNPKMVGKPVAQSRVGRPGSPLANSINQTKVNPKMVGKPVAQSRVPIS